MIQVRQDIVVVKTLSIELDGFVLIELNYKLICFQVGGVYSPPTGNKQDCLDNSNSFLSSFQSSSMPIIVCGDLNVVVIWKNQLVEKYLEVHASNGFEQAVKEVTRVCETTQTFLDHFIIKNILIFGVEVLEDHCSSDHFPVVLEWHMRISHQAT